MKSIAFPWSFPSGWYCIARWQLSGSFSGCCHLCNVIPSRSWGPAEMPVTFGSTLCSRSPLGWVRLRRVCALCVYCPRLDKSLLPRLRSSARHVLLGRALRPCAVVHCGSGRVCFGHRSWSSKLGAPRRCMNVRAAMPSRPDR